MLWVLVHLGLGGVVVFAFVKTDLWSDSVWEGVVLPVGGTLLAVYLVLALLVARFQRRYLGNEPSIYDLTYGMTDVSQKQTTDEGVGGVDPVNKVDQSGEPADD